MVYDGGVVHKVATSLLAGAALLAVQVRQVRAADDQPQVVPYDQYGEEEEYGDPVNPQVHQRPDAPVRTPLRQESGPAPRPMPAPLPATPGRMAPVAPGLAPMPGLPPPAPPAPSRPRTGEGGLGLMQFVLGVAAFGGTILLASSLDSNDLVVLGVLAAPLSTAAMVCVVGLASEHNESRCAPSIGYSYLGAIGGLLVGYSVAAASDFDDSSLLMLLGLPVAGSVIGAVAAWHHNKTLRPRPRLRAFAPELPRPLLRDRDRIPRLTVPVLSISF